MTTVDDTGFHRTRLDERLAQVIAGFQGIYGAGIDVAAESPDGQWINILAELVADNDELAEVVYNAMADAGATGAQLARLATLTGITKKPATFSTVTINVTGTPSTVIPTGSLIGLGLPGDDTNVKFEVQPSSITIGGGGTGSGTARSIVTGPVHAAAGHLTKKLMVISGWDTVTNPSDAALGANAETDPALRIRRRASVAIPSQAMTDGLYAQLLDLPNVHGAAVYENFSGAPVQKGTIILPPHSLYAIVDGGDPADIANAIWVGKSQGSTLVGSITQDVTDTQGKAQTMRWDAPVDAPIYVTVLLNVATNTTVKNQIKQAIVDYGTDAFGIGQEVEWLRLADPINPITKANALKALSIFIGRAPSPTLEADVVMDFNEIARWDISRIVVNP